MGKVGRPKKYIISKLVERGVWSENWKEELYELGRQGKTKVHIMNHLGLSRQSYYDLMRDNKEFYETVNKTMELSQQWWMDIAQQRWIEGNEKNINSNHWSLIMRNMFKEDWSDRKEMDVTTQGDKIKNDNDIIVKVIPPKDTDGDTDD
jgi:hypothetical protein